MAKGIKTGGMAKGYKYPNSRKKLWYTNGINEILLDHNLDTIPDGYTRGRLKGRSAWNKGLTKDTDDRMLKISMSLSNQRSKRVWTDEYVLSIVNDDVYKYWWDNGKAKTIKKYRFPPWVWEYCCDVLGIVESDEHKKHMYDLIYDDRWRKNQSDRLKGVNTWSKDSHHSGSAIENWKKSYHSRTEEDIKLSKLKEYRTKKKNGTFKASKPEDEYYLYLVKAYGEDNVVRQYLCDRYPFYCDFYIKSEDLFIEFNLHWTHGGRKFDCNDEECIEQLNLWISKDTDFYRNAIHTWTVRDIDKFNWADKNNLNYMAVYEWNKEN